MKRAYKKPSIAVESFQLNAAIAGSCADANKIPLNHGMETCSLGPAGFYFVLQYECDISFDDPDDEFYCYHGSTSLSPYFES